MKLKDLIKKIKVLDYKGNLETEIYALSQKATDKKEKYLLFCYKGVNFDSHDFVNNARANGCVALIVEHFIEDCDLTQILVKNTRNIMPIVCKTFFSNVQKKLKIIGVTGTNGKTTTSTLLYEILSLKYRTALIGTNGVFYNDKKLNFNMTTPDTVDLFYLLDDFVKSNIEVVVMEVSAHAIDLKKIKGLRFEYGIFTNLSQDHLDYFKTMGKYALCKLKFLNKTYCKNCIINTDDSYGEMFAKICNSKVYTYGIDNPCQNFAININMNISGSNFFVNVFDSVFEIKTNFVCRFNIYNVLAVIICARLLGIDEKKIKSCLSKIKRIDGRLNIYKLKNNSVAIIDYAHTPDGLEKILICLKKICQSRLIVVFGCGGDRDRLKRPKMGRIVSLYADFMFITNDNPRSEDENKIVQNILSGIEKNNFKIILDRKEAILQAYNFSKKNDIILIAGKGAEEYQEIKGIKYAFNDKQVLDDLIK